MPRLKRPPYASSIHPHCGVSSNDRHSNLFVGSSDSKALLAASTKLPQSEVVKLRIIGSVLLLQAILWPASETFAQRPPLILKMESPRRNAIQYSEGWPLRFSMKPRDDDAFGLVSSAQYPSTGNQAALLFEDRDGCLTLIDPGCPVDPLGLDETYLEFHADFDYPNLIDFVGFRRGDIDQFVNHPRFMYGTVPGDPSSVTTELLGPRLADDPNDGIGFGPNDDLPGFVLLSNIGVGRVRTASVSFAGAVNPLAEGPVLRARNLAGLMTHVGYQLRANPRSTVITTETMVPRDLFAPTIYYDVCVDEDPLPPIRSLGCETGRSAYRIEDGPLIFSIPGPFVIPVINRFTAPPPDVRVIAPPNVNEVQLVAVVVQGDAPAIVDDCTGNGRIDARDLECMGYRLISNQVKTTFTQAGSHIRCASGYIEGWPVGSAILVDFDNNGVTTIPVCPSSSGRVAVPPK